MAFLFTGGDLIQLTANHTLEPYQLRTYDPDTWNDVKRDLNHLVTKTIGGGPGDVDVDIEYTQLMSGDRVLLCTNGLTDVVSEYEIADALALRRSTQEDCQQLVNLPWEEEAPTTSP